MRTLQVIERDEREGMRPERFARLIECIVQSARPRSRYIIGPAFERLALGLKGILPAEWLEAGVRLYYQVG